MNINSVKLVYFSPTRTTKNILVGIARGFSLPSVEHIDFTLPDNGERSFSVKNEELTIIGVPVYSGRVPAVASERLQRLRGDGSPAVVVVVYGNRAYEDALLELKDIAVEAGFRPFAAGAFVGEHSFSNDATPIAVGRPDREDLGNAVEFGKRAFEKIRNMRTAEDILPLRISGNFPYKERRELPEISPETDEAACIKCGQCAAVCPTSAITVADTVETRRSACLKCCACVRSCATGARTMEDEFIKQVAEWLSISFQERKEPETFM